MPDKQEGTKESQRKPGEDDKIKDLEKRQDKLGEEKAKEKDVSGGLTRKG